MATDAPSLSDCLPAQESSQPALRSDLAVILAAIVLPLGLGLYRLGEPSFWFDEAATWHITSGSWKWLWTGVVSGEDCGGFVYALLMKLWGATFGTSEFALRVPGVLAYAATSALLVRIGGQLGSMRAGSMMALIWMCHPATLYWSRQARAYSLELLLTAGCISALLAYYRTGNRQHATLLGVGLALISLTHAFGLFVVAGFALFMIVQWLFPLPVPHGAQSARLSFRPLLGACVLTPIWMFLMQGRIKQNLTSFWITGSWADNFLAVIDSLTIYLTIGGPLMMAGLWLLSRSRANVAPAITSRLLVCLAVTTLVGPVVASMLSSGGHNFILSRYCLPAIFVVVIPVGYCFARLPWGLGWPVTATVCAIGLLSVSGRLYTTVGSDGSDTRSAMAFLANNYQPNDQILFHPKHEAVTLSYYGRDPRLANVPAEGLGSLGDRSELRARLRSLPTEHGRTWLILYHCGPQEDLRKLSPALSASARFGAICVARIEPSQKDSQPPQQ